jgi:tetratricopeptide (TPR) repeat protein
MSNADPTRIDRDGPLPGLMADLAGSKSTGVLVASSDAERREIVFVNGEIRAARSESEDERLGKWLVTRERISEDDRALTLLAQGGVDAPPLGHLLVTRGCIEQDTLEEELQELTLTIIRRAAAEIPDDCEFLEGQSSDQPDTLPDLFTKKIILIAARAFEDYTVKKNAIGGLDQLVWTSSDLEHLLDDYNLTPTEGFLLSRLDGTRSISDLFQVSALPDDQAIATLYSLMVSGVVEVGEPSTGAPDGPPPPRGMPKIDAVDESELTDQQRQERETVSRLADEVTQVDHYRALSLRPGTPADDVTKAWQKAQRRFDPNRASAEPHLRDLGAQMQAILGRAREAHEVLSSLRDRQRYDRILREVEKERKSLSKEEKGETDATVRSAIVEANLKRADELIHDGELYLAIQLLEQACALDPRPAELVKLSRLLLRNPLWTNRALSCMRRAIQIDPNYVDAWLELASFWRRRRNPERERKALEKALAADPTSSRGVQMYRELMGKRELDRLLRRAHQGRR